MVPIYNLRDLSWRELKLCLKSWGELELCLNRAHCWTRQQLSDQVNCFTPTALAPPH